MSHDRARRDACGLSRNGNNPEIRCRNAKTTRRRGGRRRGPHRRAGARRGHYRSGRDVPVSDLRQVGGRVQEIDRHRAQLPVDRLGRRDQADHREDGGFRRLGHAAQARGARQERIDPVSHGDWRRRAGGQPEGDRAGATEAVGPAARRNLSWQDQEVERPGDRRAEPRGRPAGERYQRGAPLRWLRHHLHLDELPVEDEPRVEVRRGRGASVNWPVGVGGKGNEGVASYVQRIQGSIGYVEYAYVLQNKMTYALVRNREGQFVSPSAKAFQAAAAGADWKAAPGMYLILTDAPGKDAWPIAGATFILMHRTQEKPESARQVLKFFDWAYTQGDRLAEELDYVPMPDPVVRLIQTNWKAQLKDPSGNPVY